MARFTFRLQPVLNIKRQMEDSLKHELGKALQSLENEKKKLNELKEEKKKCMSEVSSGVTGGMTVNKLRTYNTYISFIKQKITKQTEMVKSAQKIADKHREELVQMVKERKMLEKLKEKQYEQFLKEADKNEQKIVDEIISYKESTNIKS